MLQSYWNAWECTGTVMSMGAEPLSYLVIVRQCLHALLSVPVVGLGAEE